MTHLNVVKVHTFELNYYSNSFSFMAVLYCMIICDNKKEVYNFSSIHPNLYEFIHKTTLTYLKETNYTAVQNIFNVSQNLIVRFN